MVAPPTASSSKDAAGLRGRIDGKVPFFVRKSADDVPTARFVKSIRAIAVNLTLDRGFQRKKNTRIALCAWTRKLVEVRFETRKGSQAVVSPCAGKIKCAKSRITWNRHHRGLR
jgi:hypothetical protein